MKTIALLTDFGADSFYTGVMRAVLAGRAPGALVLDVTHAVTPHAVDEAAFVLDCVFDWFEPGTVFVVVVDPGVGGERRNIAVEAGGRFVVAPDNGVVGDIIGRVGMTHAVEIDEARILRYRTREAMGRTFLGRDVFAPAGAALSQALSLAELGDGAGDLETAAWLPDVDVAPGGIRARARLVDTFGNIMTGITRDHLGTAFPGVADERIEAVVDGHRLGPLRRQYAGAPSGRLVAVVNSWNRVEVSIDQGRAADAFETPSTVTLELRALED